MNNMELYEGELKEYNEYALFHNGIWYYTNKFWLDAMGQEMFDKKIRELISSGSLIKVNCLPKELHPNLVKHLDEKILEEYNNYFEINLN